MRTRRVVVSGEELSLSVGGRKGKGMIWQEPLIGSRPLPGYPHALSHNRR